MIKKIKKIEHALMVLYDGFQDLFPGTHCLTFSVTQTKAKGLPYTYGYIHIGDKCYPFDRVAGLIDMVEAKFEKNLLYQNFDKLREVLK